MLAQIITPPHRISPIRVISLSQLALSRLWLLGLDLLHVLSPALTDFRFFGSFSAVSRLKR
jgi:hypothetical protein